MKETLYQLYETSITEIKAIKDLSVMYELVNDQHFLDWLDALNECSLDPEQ